MTSTIESAIEAIRAGDAVIVIDDAARENEGDLVMAAEAMTTDRLGFFLRETSGVICASLPGTQLEALGLPLMVADNHESQGTAFTVSVDAASPEMTSGIPAADRALTLTELARPSATPLDFVRPGHIFPLRADTNGVLGRPGHTEATLDLVTRAGRGAAGVLCEVTSAEKTAMASRAELEQLARRLKLPLVSIADLIRYRLTNERLVELVSSADIPTEHGTFTCHVFRSLVDGVEHIALVRGRVDDGRPALVRVHSECVTGDVFGSRRCDCGHQLDDSLRRIAAEGRGAVVYLRDHEGRGIGIADKLRAYALQDRGRDTVDANLELGLPVDAREYWAAAQILAELDISSVRLLTNSPAKHIGLAGWGTDIVERVPLPPRITAENVAYLRTKQQRLDHQIPSVHGSGTTFVDAANDFGLAAAGATER